MSLVSFSRPAFTLARSGLSALALSVPLTLGLGLGTFSACNGCRPTRPQGDAVKPAEEGPPTLRLYLVSDLAGAMEPCGCVKDQLGGLDHLGALVRSEQPRAPAHAVLSAGPLFFMDPELTPDKRAQDVSKAETMAEVLRGLNLVAFAPARNEWAAGPETLARLQQASGAALLFANAASVLPPAGRVALREIHGVKLGIIGVASPGKAPRGNPVPGLVEQPPLEAVRKGVEELEKQGAQVFVVLASTGRGEAKRLADEFPRLTAIVVGSAGGAGEANTAAPPAERIGNVLIVETGNHLQTVAVLDLHVREGSFVFADAAGLEILRKREALAARMGELRKKIAVWEADPGVARADLEARRAELQKLEGESAQLEKVPPPEKGSFFRFTMREVRTSLGSDPAVNDKLAGYYKKVNEANRLAFADRKPRPPAKDEPSYVGIETCTGCHEEARKVWDKTAHAHAYKTLADAFKEYNLDCVSCHVTGYDRPGGSTVTAVSGLRDVQCEVCHGPGSKHAKSPTKVAVPVKVPPPDSCLACHHPPHVHEFDAASKMNLILGPGHQKK